MLSPSVDLPAEKLVALDCVSALPYADIPVDKVDAVYFSVQKGFGMPAGLGVLILSPAAVAKAATIEEAGISTGSYHSFASWAKKAKVDLGADCGNPEAARFAPQEVVADTVPGTEPVGVLFTLVSLDSLRFLRGVIRNFGVSPELIRDELTELRRSDQN